MKRLLILLLTIFGVTFIMAQEKTFYIAILPGYQIASGNTKGSISFTNGELYIYQHNSIRAQSGFVGTLDLGYYFTDNFGVHLDITYNNGNYEHDIIYIESAFAYNKYKMKNRYSDPFYILEIGPALARNIGDKGKIYFQISFGYRLGNDGVDNNLNTFGFDVKKMQPLKWVYGGAMGYRYYFNEKVGINLQLTYHNMTYHTKNNNDNGYLLDNLIGIAFRF